MTDKLKTIISQLKSGDKVEVSTTLQGAYKKVTISHSERESGVRPPETLPGKLKHSGTYLGVLEKNDSFFNGPFVDDYLQVAVIGEKAVYKMSDDTKKLVGWKEAGKIQSIPFRNISSIEVLK